jgi:Putative transposase
LDYSLLRRGRLYFHVTVTVPEELRAALRRHQIDGYGALMKAAAEAIIVLARDPRWVGGIVGVLAVLHTWTQRLVFHPHVHCLVTGGGLSDDGATWHPAGKTFLFPKTALATLARARFRDAFARLCPDADLPPHVWQIPWVVHITPWGEDPPPMIKRKMRGGNPAEGRTLKVRTGRMPGRSLGRQGCEEATVTGIGKRDVTIANRSWETPARGCGSAVSLSDRPAPGA